MARDVFSGNVPPAAAERFKFVASGVVLQVRSADRAGLNDLHKDQLVLVQEDTTGKVQNATTAQTPARSTTCTPTLPR